MINATPENVDNNFLSTSIAGVPAAYPVDFDDQGDGTYVGELAVTFIKANVNQTGDLKLTINVDPNPAQTYLLGSTTIGVITVIYVGLPELSIAGGNPVTEAEGAVASYLISASRSPNATITLHYNLTESGNFIDIEGDNKDASLDFSNQVTEVILPIPIVNDTERENAGTITVTINEDTGTPKEYVVAAPPRNTANVMVIDDESIPVIEIIPTSGSVAENGGPAKFKLVAGRLSATTTLMINATPTEGTDENGNDHDFLAAAVENTESIFTVEFTDQGNGIYFGELAVAVDNDDVGEATGTIKLTIHENQAKTYQLGSVTEGTITVWDDDAPELSISGGNSVVEADGAVATFTISAEVSPNEMVTVHYRVSEESAGDGDFLAPSEEGNKDPMLDFSSGATSVDLTIQLVSDDTSEANAEISVQLLTEDHRVQVTYFVSDTKNTASVIAIDDDGAPQIVITPGNSPITEGEAAIFNLTANFAIQNSVNVQFTVCTSW